MISSHLSEYEVSLLSSLVDQLIGMMTADQQPVDNEADPFEALARDLEGKADPPEDPVLHRLFPDAYRGDPVASADFRRFTQRELSDKKVAEARVVLAGLERTQSGSSEVRIPVEEVDVWLRTLTSLRLAVAVRLGISDPDSADELAGLPDDDPRAFMASIYDWLGFAEETLITAL